MTWTDWDDTLCHYGKKGMHWGIRNYQNPDGTLTEEGRLRYTKSAGKAQKTLNRLDREYADAAAYLHRENYKAEKQNKKLNKKLNKIIARGDANSIERDEASIGKSITTEFDRNSKSVRKTAAKMKKASDNAAKIKKDMANIEKMQWQLMAQSHMNGYKVATLPVTRIGRTKTAKMLSTIGNLALASIDGGANWERVEGKQFKVRK